MVDLSTLLASVHPSGGQAPKEFWIFSNLHWLPDNGGCCYEWTVPKDTTYIRFEILGGGGPGNSGGPGDWGPGGSGGNYGMKQIFSSGECIKGGSNYETRTGATSSGTTCGTCCNTNGSCRPCVNETGTCVLSPNIDSGNAVYTICAAGTSPCSCCLQCQHFPCNRHGCPSYVNGPGLGTAGNQGEYQDADVNFCVLGGTQGTQFCDTSCSCYNCFIPGQCCEARWSAGWNRSMCNCGFGYDLFFSGTSGWVSSEYSCNSGYGSSPGMPTGPITTYSGQSGDKCSCSITCCSGHSHFPGGGGYSHLDDDIAYYGGFGAAGLVKVTYQ